MSDEVVRLDECPPGLFMFGDTIGFRSEYSTVTPTNPSQPDAYVVESGEYFWGGVNGDSRARSALMVRPIEPARIRSALTHPVLPDREGVKLVPVQPTLAQRGAGLMARDKSGHSVTEIYRAMIAASPATGEREPLIGKAAADAIFDPKYDNVVD